MKIYNEEYLKGFGEFIKEGRERRNLSQTEVAEQVGIRQPYYSQIERGDRNADLTLAMTICKILDLDMSDFIKRYM